MRCEKKTGTKSGNPHLELHVDVVGSEEVDHPSNPSLLLCHFFGIVRLLLLLLIASPSSSAYASVTTTSRISDDRSVQCLVFDQDATHAKYAADIFGGLDDRLVLEHAADNRVGDGPTRVVRLTLKQRDISWNGEKGENG